jgi:hypothetical protein
MGLRRLLRLQQLRRLRRQGGEGYPRVDDRKSDRVVGSYTSRDPAREPAAAPATPARSCRRLYVQPLDARVASECFYRCEPGEPGSRPIQLSQRPSVRCKLFMQSAIDSRRSAGARRRIAAAQAMATSHRHRHSIVLARLSVPFYLFVAPSQRKAGSLFSDSSAAMACCTSPLVGRRPSLRRTLRMNSARWLGNSVMAAAQACSALARSPRIPRPARSVARRVNE